MKITLGVGALAGLQLVIGLLSQLLIIRIIGVGKITDAYIAAQTIPMIISAVATVSLQAIWLPRFSLQASSTSGMSGELRAAQGQCLRLFIYMLPAVALLLAGATWLFPGFSEEQIRLVRLLTIALLISTTISTLSTLLMCGLRAKDRFHVGEVINTVSMVGCLVWFWFAIPQYGIYAVAFGLAARAVFAYVLHARSLSWPRISLMPDHLSQGSSGKLKTLMFGTSIIKLNPLVDRALSSRESDGAVTVFNLAQLLMSAMASIMERALVSPVLPAMSRYLQSGQTGEVKAVYFRRLWQIAGAVGVIGLLILGFHPIWGQVMKAALGIDHASAYQIWAILLLLVPALFVLVAGPLAVAVFYAGGNTKIPIVIGLIGFFVGVLTKIVLFKFMGLVGIAIGASAYLLCNMLAYHLILLKQFREKRFLADEKAF